MSARLISIVVPTHNERENVAEFSRRLRDVFSALDGTDFELIFCDDSTDDTPHIIAELHRLDPRVKLIRLSRRFGQAVALSAGLDHSSGHAAILMDADLQDPPEAIPLLLEKWKQGHNMVCVRRPSAGDGALYRGLAFIFYRLLAGLSAVPVPVDVGEFRLLDRRVVQVLSTLPEHTRYMREMTLWPGFSQCFVELQRQARREGRTKYNLWRSFSVALDGIISSSVVPLRVCIFAGFAISCGSFILGLFYFAWKLYSPSMLGVGWTSLFLGLNFLGGIQLVFLGVIGEYVGRIFTEVQARPLYLVDYCLGIEADVLPPASRRGRP